MLETLQEQTAKAIANLNKNAKITGEQLDLVAIYREMGVGFGAEAQLYEARLALAESLGFKPLEVATAAGMLLGGPPDRTETMKGRQEWTWFYDHNRPEALPTQNTSWGGGPTAYYKMKKISAFVPPKASCVIFGKVNCLKRKIPPGVVLAMREISSLKLFNCFSVLAPKDMWEDKKSTEPDPILFATIAMIMPDKDRGQIFADCKHFFVARWDEAK